MFGSIDIKVRPIKIAYLVDPNNAKQVRQSIQLSSSLWGGSSSPILPIYKRMPKTWKDGPLKAPLARKVILGYLEAFDPDVLVQFSKTVPDYINGLGLEIVKPTTIWELLDEEKRLSPKFGLGIFEILNETFEEHFKYKEKYPIKVVIPEIPKKLSLFWASWFGEIPAKLMPILERNYFKPLEVEAIKFQPDKLKDVMAGNILFPRRITQEKLDYHSRSGFRRDAYVYFFDAAKTDDVIDFWNLRAMGKQVIPVPKQLKDDPGLRELVINFLRDHRRHWPHDPKVCDYASIMRGRSCTMEEVQEFAKTLSIQPEPNDTSSDPFFSLQHWYPRIWDEWARDKDGAVPADVYGEEDQSIEISDAKELKFQFKSLLPKFALKRGYSGEPRCANEVSFRFYSSEQYLAEVLPKSTGENFVKAISGITSFRGDWRVGRNGLVKLVKDGFTEAREVPAAENIVFAWLSDRGWKPKLSPPGLLVKQIYRRFEGHPIMLRNEKLLGLLEYMNGGTVNRDHTPVEKNEVNQERDVPVGEVRTRIEGPHGNLYEYLLSKNIFKLGLRVQCPRCVRNSWFPLENIKDDFLCPKCQEMFSAIGSADGGTWSYKTTGPFSVPNYGDGAYAVLLALEFFNDRIITTLRTTSAPSFAAEGPDKKSLEADFMLFWEESIYGERQDGLVFGECKTYGKFVEKDFERMRYLAKTFPGAVLAFCTLRKSITKKEIAQITRIAKVGRKYWKAERPLNPVMILTGNELLTYPGPPYCWEDSVKQKFDRMRPGLLSIADATQQIYLGLQSWQTEWHEKWERRHKRMLAKRGIAQERQD